MTSPKQNPNPGQAPRRNRILGLLEERGVLNIAHRGARSLAPENTLAAAAKAYALGAHLWELDVAMTRDHVPIVVHDDDLARTSNAPALFPQRDPWPVEAFTLSEIRRLDFGRWFVDTDPFGSIEAGEVTPAEIASYQGLAAPTLEEALTFSRLLGWPVNVEIKDQEGRPDHDRIVQAVLDLIGRLDMMNLVLVSSFNHDYLRQARRREPDLCLGVLVERFEADALDLVRDLEAQTFHPPRKYSEPRQVEALSRQGVPVFVWTVNREPDMRRFLEAGARGLITDFPQRLRNVLQP
jgi:glycerophosphoryl diester phosphodiesterase